MKCLSVLATVDIKVYLCFESTVNPSRRRTFRWTMNSGDAAYCLPCRSSSRDGDDHDVKYFMYICTVAG